MGNKKIKCRLSEHCFSLKLMFFKGGVLSVIDLPSFERDLNDLDGAGGLWV